MIDGIEIIKDENGDYVNMENIYNLHTIKTPYRKWIVRQIKIFGLKEFNDFWIKKRNSTGGRPKKDYFCAIEQALIINQREKLNAIIGSGNRKEIVYIEELESILLSAGLIPKSMRFLYQYRIDSFRVDCCLLELKLVIEFDERHHENKVQKEKDLERQKIIEDAGFKVIRVKEGKESIGTGEIIKYLIKAWG